MNHSQLQYPQSLLQCCVRLGYFFCQVFPSENVRALGVPDVQTLEEIADRGKVTDLQNDVVEFGELDPNISYDAWCEVTCIPERSVEMDGNGQNDGNDRWVDGGYCDALTEGYLLE